MVDMRSTNKYLFVSNIFTVHPVKPQPKTSDIFVKCNTQLVVFILNELQIVPSFPRQKYFSFPTKDTFHSQHEK